MTSRLTAAQLKQAFTAKVQSSCLTPTDLKALKFELIADISKQPGMSKQPAMAGFRIPYFDHKGKERPKVCRYRYLEDTRSGFTALTNAKPMRYTQPAGTAVHLYFPPNGNWPAVVDDIEYPIMITEGELKAACATRFKLPTVGLGGVYSFRSAKAGQVMIPDFDAINWAGRRVYICFDSDAVTNKMVVNAEYQLARDLLLIKCADVYIVRLPPAADGGKQGLDDYILAHGFDKFVKEVIENEDVTTQFEDSRELHQMNTEFVYVRKPGIVYDYAHSNKLNPRDFIGAQYADRWIERVNQVEDPKTGKTKSVKTKKSAPQEWLGWPGRSVLRELSYRPGQPEVTADGTLNEWKAWGVEDPAPGDIKPWKELLDHLFEDTEPEARRWFERWCAYPFQHPGTKMASAVVFWGPTHGSGKTLAGQTLMALYGTENAAEVKDSDLEDERFEWAAHRQFVLADDITGQDNRKLANKFKTMITQKYLRINPKYIASYYIEDCINYFFTSNDPDALYLDDGDRRFFVHHVCSDKMTEPLRKRYIAWLEDPDKKGLRALFHYFLTMDLGDFDPRREAYRTAAKEDMTQMGKSTLGSFVARLRAEPDDVLGRANMKGDLFTAEELLALYSAAQGDTYTKTNPNTLSREMVRAGFLKASKGPLPCAVGQRRAFIVRNVGKWRSAPIRDLVAEYDKHHPAFDKKVKKY